MALGALNTNDSAYQAGGYSADNLWNSESSTDPNPFSGIVGRIRNNFSGTTAANQATFAENERNRIFNSAEAEKQRSWEREMASTQYQRAVDDMRKAGINPAMLAGTANLSSSSAGAGSSASSSSVSASSAGHSNALSTIIGGLVQMFGYGLKYGLKK